MVALHTVLLAICSPACICLKPTGTRLACPHGSYVLQTYACWAANAAAQYEVVPSNSGKGGPSYDPALYPKPYNLNPKPFFQKTTPCWTTLMHPQAGLTLQHSWLQRPEDHVPLSFLDDNNNNDNK